MRLTVAICTWNRAALLDQTLARLRDLRVPAGVEWELLVVNNNCTDATDAVAARHAAALPLRLLHEPTTGLSHARNRAVREASGEYVVWTDDDVLVEPDWLEAYAAAFARHPGAAVFGGPIRPWYEGTPPRWLEAAFARVSVAFAAMDLGPGEVLFAPGRAPFGANMAFRTATARRFPFDPALGVIKGKRLNGEETTVIEAMLAAGHTGWWVPDAPVRHYIPRARQSVAFLRAYYAGLGERRASLLDWPADVPRLFGRPRWLWRDWAAKELRYRWRRAVAPPTVWIDALMEASQARGRLAFAAGDTAGGLACA